MYFEQKCSEQIAYTLYSFYSNCKNGFSLESPRWDRPLTFAFGRLEKVTLIFHISHLHVFVLGTQDFMV